LEQDLEDVIRGDLEDRIAPFDAVAAMVILREYLSRQPMAKERE
jgi:RNase H-fold protein (predicted Holliday junction resolvase)